jgi:hypothetical protein
LKNSADQLQKADRQNSADDDRAQSPPRRLRGKPPRRTIVRSTGAINGSMLDRKEPRDAIERIDAPRAHRPVKSANRRDGDRGV